jgi:hypothetical protein
MIFFIRIRYFIAKFAPLIAGAHANGAFYIAAIG